MRVDGPDESSIISVEGVVVGVELVVAAGAEQGELVEVGGAFGGCVPGGEVVDVATLVFCGAQDAAFVAQYQCVTLDEAAWRRARPSQSGWPVWS